MTGWTTPLRAGAFALGLLVVLGLGALAGRAVGPIEVTASAEHGHETDDDRGSHGGHADTLPAGLAVSDGGYTLLPAQTRLHAGDAVPVAFTITGPDGHPVTAFDTVHDKALHLIAIRRDLTGFQHVHPTMDAHGHWTTALELTPGPWRLLADFRPTGGTATTLGVDVQTAGHYDPAPPAPTSRVATVGDYTVHLDGRLVAGDEAELTLSVSRAGRPVTDLQPYLGAYGHLVALREGDLAYLHVHPEGEPGDGTTRPGPAITFRAHVPTAGAYRLFLDFRHHGVVRTAEFALSAPNGHGGDQHQEDHDDAGH